MTACSSQLGKAVDDFSPPSNLHGTSQPCEHLPVGKKFPGQGSLIFFLFVFFFPCSVTQVCDLKHTVLIYNQEQCLQPVLCCVGIYGIALTNHPKVLDFLFNNL